MNALLEESPVITQRDIAIRAMEECANKTLDAKKWLVRWLGENLDWVLANQDEIFGSWASAAVHRTLSDQRRSLGGETSKGGPAVIGGSVVPFQSTLTAAINSNYSRMMDAPLWGGKKIGESTPQEIRESASKFELNGRTLARQARWQLSVAEKAEANGCGINESVKTALPPKLFEELWEESDV